MLLEFAAVAALMALSAPAPHSSAPAWTPAPVEAREGDARLIPAQDARRQTPPRWHRGVCVGAVGLSPEQSQFLVDRISQRANDLGLSAGRPGCDANIVVSFTADPNGVAAAITRSRDFNAGGRGRTRDRATLRSFTEGREPVRWWYVWQTVADTGELANRDEREGGRGPEVTVQDRGRVGSRTRDDMSNVFVVIDGPQIANVNMNALADYIAMVSLGQFDADTTTGGQPSILNLFRDRTPQTALTDWDRQTLRALYR